MPFPPASLPPKAAFEIVRARFALEHTRERADPSTPLACYVLDLCTIAGDRAYGAIAWSDERHPRALTENMALAVGWAPLDALARYLDGVAADEARALRAMGACDVRAWSVAYVGERPVVVRTTRAELESADLDALEAAIPTPPPRQPETRDPNAIVIYSCGPGCGRNRCDDLGPEYAEFYENGKLAVSSATCSKCGADAMSVSMWG